MRHPLLLRSLLLLLICFSVNVGLNAQDIKEEKTYPYELSNKGEVIKFRLLKKNPRHFKPEINHIYYWFLSNGIHSTNGGVGGKLLQGTYTSYYADMSLKESGKMQLGQKTGKWTSWYQNGTIQSRVHLKNGLIHGKCITYDEDIRNCVQSNYHLGKLKGLQRTFVNGVCIEKKKFRQGTLIPPKEPRVKKTHKKEKEEKPIKKKRDPQEKKSIKKDHKKDLQPAQKKCCLWVKKIFVGKKKSKKKSNEKPLE